MIAEVDSLPIAVTGAAASERADAARNRARILAAAARLVDARGIENVSMDDVAREAEVGTGTLYRRFGDRAGLALALLDEHTREFQDALISGPAPLGPGAPAEERLIAFGAGYLAHLERHGALIAAGTPNGAEGGGPFRFYLTHLVVLLRDAAPHCDPEYTAHALLAALAPWHHVMLRRDLGWSLERLRDGWEALVRALTA